MPLWRAVGRCYGRSLCAESCKGLDAAPLDQADLRRRIEGGAIAMPRPSTQAPVTGDAGAQEQEQSRELTTCAGALPTSKSAGNSARCCR